MKALAGVLCLMLFAGTAASQTGKVLTLDAAVSLALERNVEVVKARNRYDGTFSEVRAAYGNLLPSLNASGSFSRSQNWKAGGTELSGGVPITYPSGFSAFNNFSAGIGSSLTLFDGFANTSGISRARSDAVVSEKSLERTRQSVILQTHVLFLNIARGYQLLAVADDNLKRSRRQLERITESNKVGAVALADVYRQQVQVGTDELSLIGAQSDYESAKADLIAYLGVEYDEDAYTIDVSGFPAEIDTAEFAELNARYSSFDNLVATGVEQRPDHRAAAEALNAASSSVTIARAGHLPSLTASGSYGYSSDEFGKLIVGGIDNSEGDRSLSLSLRLSVPIFNGFSTTNAVDQASISEMNAREDLDQSERQIAVDIRKGLLNLEQAEKRLIVTKTSVVSAEMDRKIAEEKYNLGAGTLLDMLVATANYTNAMSGKVNASFDYLLAKKTMEHALGTITQ